MDNDASLLAPSAHRGSSQPPAQPHSPTSQAAVESITCPHCSGSGKTPLTGVYLETLEVVRRRFEPHYFVIANQHAEIFGCTPTALNNRLSRLEELGFLRSERYGRERRFYAV